MSSATPRHRVPAGVTALRVLDLLAASPRGRGVSDIAESLGLDPGQAHRLLRHLVEDGWVAQTEARGRYVITGRLLSIAGTLLGHLELRECAMPILEAVQTRIRETVAAGPDCLYACFPDAIGRSKLTIGVVERTLKLTGTGRNWNTVGKLTELTGES